MWLAQAVPSSSQRLAGGCAASTAEISISPARAGLGAAAAGQGRQLLPSAPPDTRQEDRMAKPKSGVGSGWQEVRGLWPRLVRHKEKFRVVSEASRLSEGFL